MNEIILTILILLVLHIFHVRIIIPYFIEWLESVNIDDTTDGKGATP